MPKVETTVAHALGLDEAITRLRAHSDVLQKHWASQVSDVVEEWADDVLNVSFKAFGFPIRAQVTPEPEAVAVAVDIPVAAIMLKGAIKQQINKDLEVLLA